MVFLDVLPRAAPLNDVVGTKADMVARKTSELQTSYASDSDGQKRKKWGEGVNPSESENPRGAICGINASGESQHWGLYLGSVCEAKSEGFTGRKGAVSKRVRLLWRIGESLRMGRWAGDLGG